MRRLMTAAGIVFASAILIIMQGCSGMRPSGGPEKTLMHVFAYTPVQGATEQDFQAFTKATGDLVGKIPGLKRVWVGKLREPFVGEGDKVRTYGVAMEFDNFEALQVYAKHPAHDEWGKIYEKVRQQGTTTLDISGE